MFYMFSLFMQVMYATPETWAGRLLYCAFLGFAFVMTSSYTAQLASFLTYQGRKLYFKVRLQRCKCASGHPRVERSSGTGLVYFGVKFNCWLVVVIRTDTFVSGDVAIVNAGRNPLSVSAGRPAGYEPKHGH
jgi:hypothetical protein